MQDAVDKTDIQITWFDNKTNGWSTWRISRFDFIMLIWDELRPNTRYMRGVLIGDSKMTEQEQLFADYFKKAYDAGMDIEHMSYEELDAWITNLEKVVFEAKATLQGADAAKRERKSRLSAADKEKTRSADSQFITSDAINAVRKRADRLSKRDKLIENYVNLGMELKEAEELVGKIVSVNEDTQAAKNNLITFNKPADTEKEKPKSVLDKMVESIMKAEEKKKADADEPFDPNSLFG